MKRGGMRPNAGRKRGSGRYGEPTKALRVPLSRVDEILKLLETPPLRGISMPLDSFIQPIEDLYWWPLYSSESVSCGSHTSLVDLSEKFNLNAYLLPHPERMVFIRVPDMAMSGQGIDEGNIVIVDIHRPLSHGCLIAAIINNKLMIRQVIDDKGGLLLIAANPLYAAIPVTGDLQFTLVGVITTVIHEISM